MWALDGSAAVYTSPQTLLRVDLGEPSPRICEWQAGGAPVHTAGSLLAVQQPGRAREPAYIRGLDLVARFERSDRDAAYETYWRGLPVDSGPATLLASLELIVSVETPRLDMEPELTIISDLPAAVSAAGDNWATVRYPNGFTYIEMAHPSNVRSCRFERTRTGSTSCYSLFPGKLEKGVIRRARCRAYLLADSIDERAAEGLATELYDAFVVSPPPLTT